MHPVALQPGVTGTGTNVFSAAEGSDGGVPPEALPHDGDLLFSGKLAAGNVFDIPDESLRLFGPGLSLSVPA